MEAKHMKTSHSKAWECNTFIHGFMIFRITNNMEIGVNIHTSHTQYLESNILSKVQAPLQQVRHQMRAWGNGEEGMRECGDR